jgi:hypothetical protein
MNADRFKYKEITDIILRSFYEAYKMRLVMGFWNLSMIMKEKISVMISVDRWLNSYSFLIFKKIELCDSTLRNSTFPVRHSTLNQYVQWLKILSSMIQLFCITPVEVDIVLADLYAGGVLGIW